MPPGPDDALGVTTSEGKVADGTVDSELLTEASSNGGAFSVFFDRNYLQVLEYFSTRVGVGEDAADLCAETFAAALDGLDRFDRTVGSGRQWLYGIARNLLFHYWRDMRVSSAARNRLGIAQVVVDEETLTAMSRVEARADGGFIERALEALPETLRQAVRLRVVAQLSYDEMAQILDCTTGTARQRVNRGLTRLRSRHGGTL